MKVESSEHDLDRIDLAILELLQENCKQSLATIGEKVGLSAPSVVERIHKLEDSGIIQGYTAVVDARRLGKDVTAFIGLNVSHPRWLEAFEREIQSLDEVLECHHVTGSHTLLLKAKTDNTSSLERLIDRLRRLEGVTETETMVVLSSQRECSRVALNPDREDSSERGRRNGHPRSRRPLRRSEPREEEEASDA